jgi:hypothetical protein
VLLRRTSETSQPAESCAVQGDRCVSQMCLGQAELGAPGCSFNGYSWANFFRSGPAMSSPDLSGWVSIWAPNRGTQDARVFLLAPLYVKR